MIKKLGKKFFEILTMISPSLSARILYIYDTHEIPHLKNPKNFNEKMTNLKLTYKDNQLISQCADKYEVREYVKSKGLENTLNELYFVYDNPNEIDFEKLPEKFVLKCTHGCGYNIICNDKSKIDIEKTKKKLGKWQKEKFGLATTELHYTNIKPRIICEKYLCDESGKLPIDYKIYCFYGVPKCILVCSDRETETKGSYYDLSWNRLNYETESFSYRKNIEKPKNLDKMIEYATKLSQGFDFVRVDFYNDDGKIIFGELTFTPYCCCNPTINKQGNIELGKLLK